MKKKRVKWEPPIFDKDIDKNPDWKKCYTVAIPNLPLRPNKKVVKFMDDISKMDGFIGLRPEYPYGTLLMFDTENHAKIARNRINNYPQYQGGTGKNIGECHIPKEYYELGLSRHGERAEEPMVD